MSDRSRLTLLVLGVLALVLIGMLQAVGMR